MAFEEECKIIKQQVLNGDFHNIAFDGALSIIIQAIADGYILTKEDNMENKIEKSDSDD